ncbi:MAG: DNA repair protein RecO C-terminal domain-containing protein [Venatoribacter sp.]
MQTLFVLKRQPLREHDWLLDVFSLERGRLTLVLNRPSYFPDLFTPYQGDWQTSRDWPLIKAWQIGQAYPLQDNALYCGLYLNELLNLLLPPNEPLPELFQAYQRTLEGLSQFSYPAPWLRLFEWQLLQDLGYGFSWLKDKQGLPIAAHKHYIFTAKEGFSEAATGFLGEYLLAFAQGSHDLNVWKQAQQVLRQALDSILEQPLLSRELLHIPKA